MSFISILKGLWLLRHPEMVRHLGNMRLDAIQLAQLHSAFPRSNLNPDILVQGWPEGKLFLASGVKVEKGVTIALGDNTNGFGSLSIQKDTWIGQYNNFRLAGGTGITIGEGCLISQFCSLVAANHRVDRHIEIRRVACDTTKQDIIIGNDVWIGVGAAIMPGTTVGDGAVIGANSVVNKFVPEYEIWAGVPAIKIRERT